MRQQHEEQEEAQNISFLPQHNSPDAHHADTQPDTQQTEMDLTAAEAEQVVMGQAQVRTRLEEKRQTRKWQALHNNPTRAALTGIFAANGMALVVMMLTRWVYLLSENTAGIFTAGEFVLLPMAMGGICAYFWQEAKLSKMVYSLYGLLNTGLALLLSYLFLKEGTICLLMASPLILIFVLLGSFIGRKIFAAKHRQLNACLAPILLTLFVADSLSLHHFANQETDQIVINAPPQRVWQYIIAYPANNAPSDYWLCRLGLPAPIQSTANGHSVGAKRQCLFTGNIGFEERLTEVTPGKRLTFDVTTQPNHPEVVGHFALQTGQFTLQDNHNGTTTLTGTTWYKLNVYPICYYDWWTQDVIRHVHLRVMRHIKALAEQHVVAH